MALSGSKDFTVTRDDIIETALKKIGSYDAGEAISAAEKADASTALNLIIKEWAVEGITMPVRTKNILILNKGKQRYRLGNIGTTATTDDFHFFPATELLENVTTADEPALETEIACTDTAWVDHEGNNYYYSGYNHPVSSGIWQPGLCLPARQQADPTDQDTVCLPFRYRSQ
jgi:hypothetical protein